MSWLSKAIKKVAHADPVTNAVRGAGLDPIGSAVFGDTKKLDAAPEPAPAMPDQSMQAQPYQGDQNDPSYGSFTQPFDINEFYKYQDPGYWWRLQQGSQAVQNGAAAHDGALSGAALKDLMGYNQDMASTEYGNAFNRYQTSQGNIFSRLMGIAGLGQSAAAGVGAQGTALAGQAGQAIQNAGTAQGGGIVGAGNSIAGAASDYGAYKYLSQNPGMWRGSGPQVVQ